MRALQVVVAYDDGRMSTPEARSAIRDLMEQASVLEQIGDRAGLARVKLELEALEDVITFNRYHDVSVTGDW